MMEADERPPLSGALILLTVFAVLGGFLFGYDTGVVSGAEVFVQNDLGLSDAKIQVVVSVTVLFAAVGSALAGAPLQARGRKPVIMVASCFYCLGSLTVAAARGFGELVAGRVVLGLGVGLSSMAIPVYVAEASPAELRGRLVSCYNLFIVLGQAAACGVNIVCGTYLGTSSRWRVSMGVAAAPAFLQLIGFVYLPESPRWLAQTGDVDGAARVLETLRGRAASSSLIERDLRQLRAMEPEDVGDCAGGLSEVRRTPHLRATFRLGLGLMALQQFSGVNTIMYYGAAILIMCGFEEEDSVALTAVLALAQGLGIVISLPLWERCGRRRLLVPSALAAAAAMACVALAFWAGIDTYKYVGLVGVVTYLIGFGLGLSSGPWVVNAEIYPTRLRGLGQASACTANWAANYVVAATFLSLCKALGQASTFALLSCISLAGAAWLRGALPETAGRSLEEIEDLFRARSYGQVRTADEDEARNPLGDDEAM
mmetsp:Transcript_12740/g.33693  ORF Transcript_12740/g.33693 Transcript_12740/m.33693 type:complete len:485 (-) Transcript_12740:20-1474(-)